eukprot:1150212-Pelagomonas_calceolata.AAC.1
MCDACQWREWVWSEEADQQHGDLSRRLASSITALEQSCHIYLATVVVLLFCVGAIGGNFEVRH